MLGDDARARVLRRLRRDASAATSSTAPRVLHDARAASRAPSSPRSARELLRRAREARRARHRQQARDGLEGARHAPGSRARAACSATPRLARATPPPPPTSSLARMFDAKGRLLRVYDRGRAHVTGFLDDHAALLEACLDLHRAGAGARFLDARAAGSPTRSRRASSTPAEGDLFLTPVGRRAAGAAPALGPRRRDAALDRARGAGSAARGGALGTRRRSRASRSACCARTRPLLERAPEAFPTPRARRAAGFERGRLGRGRDRRRTMPRAPRSPRARARVLAPEDAVLVAAPGETPPGVDPDLAARPRRPRPDARPPSSAAASPARCRSTVPTNSRRSARQPDGDADAVKDHRDEGPLRGRRRRRTRRR